MRTHREHKHVKTKINEGVRAGIFRLKSKTKWNVSVVKLPMIFPAYQRAPKVPGTSRSNLKMNLFQKTLLSRGWPGQRQCIPRHFGRRGNEHMQFLQSLQIKPDVCQEFNNREKDDSIPSEAKEVTPLSGFLKTPSDLRMGQLLW